MSLLSEPQDFSSLLQCNFTFPVGAAYVRLLDENMEHLEQSFTWF